MVLQYYKILIFVQVHNIVKPVVWKIIFVKGKHGKSFIKCYDCFYFHGIVDEYWEIDIIVLLFPKLEVNSNYAKLVKISS